MIKFFTKKLNNKKGFTLIELIVVIAILGILIAIVVPRIGKFRTEAAINSHNSNVRALESAVSLYLAQVGFPTTLETWSASSNDSVWKEYITEWPTVPKGSAGDHTGSDGTTVTITEGQKYEVKIDTDGKTTVTPGRIGTP